jgi:hypothetical protein
MIDLKHKKTFVCGTTGTGKTYLVEHKLIKNFKHPFVYLIHQEDFTSCKNNVKCYIPRYSDGTINLTMEHLDKISKMIKEQAQQGKIDAFIIDEADMFIPKDMRTLQVYHNFYDLLINHRHYGKEKGKGLALIFVTRRPQEMTTVFIEQCHYIFMFAIEGKNTKAHFNKIHHDFDDLIPRLSIEKHNFIFKEIGKPPTLHNEIKTSSDTPNKSQDKPVRVSKDTRQQPLKNSERGL